MKKQKRESDNLKKLTPERQKIRAWKIWPKLARYAFCRLSRHIGRCMWAAYLHRSERARSVGHISHGSGGAGASTGAPLAAACGSVADRRLAEINALRRNPLGAGGRRRVRRSAGRLLAAAVAWVGAAQSVAPLGCAHPAAARVRRCGAAHPLDPPTAAAAAAPPARPSQPDCAVHKCWRDRDWHARSLFRFTNQRPHAVHLNTIPVCAQRVLRAIHLRVCEHRFEHFERTRMYLCGARESGRHRAADCERAFHLHMCVRVCCGAHQMTPVIYAHFKSSNKPFCMGFFLCLRGAK